MPFPTPFPVKRIRIDCIAHQALTWPDFAGSMLRGALGHALKRAACITGAQTCTGCAVRPACPYSVVFEPPPPAKLNHGSNTQSPPAYVIEPPPIGARPIAAGETFSFHIVLIGSALAHEALVLHAMSRALSTLDTMPNALRQTAHAAVDAPCASLPAPMSTANALSLQFHTPLRIQHHGKPMRDGTALIAKDILMSSVKRAAQVCETLLGQTETGIPFKTLSAASEHIALSQNMQWHELNRYSSRQKRAIPLGGLIGTVHLQGELAPFAHYLYLGQWLHIGKETAFGLGHYTLCT